MNDRYISLRDLVVCAVPPGFLKALLEEMGGIYRESHETVFNDTNLDDRQARYVRGHYRRGRAETQFSRLAAQYGLKQRVEQPENGGCNHIVVSAGTLSLVLCHVYAENAFPKHSDNREQASRVNDHLSQVDFFPAELKRAYDRSEDAQIYGIIIHSENGNDKSTLGSIKIGFPNCNCDGWIEEPICLNEISDLQDRQFQKPEDLQGQVQDVMPKWKKSEVENSEAV